MTERKRSVEEILRHSRKTPVSTDFKPDEALDASSLPVSVCTP